jgi:hypothetical protein
MGKKPRYSIHASVFTLILMTFVGCSGSSGGGYGGNDGYTSQTPHTEPSSSNWDEMIWDQDNWG